MHDELVKRLRNSAVFLPLDGSAAELFTQAADVIEELSRRLEQALYMPVPRWIPMTERPPEDELCFYSCCTNKGVVVECLWTNNKYGLGPCGEWGWRLMDVPQYQHITHWMPLPELPKENGKSET